MMKKNAQTALKKIIEKYCDSVSIIGEASSGYGMRSAQ